MSTFDLFSDAPGLLRTEALNITLKFDRTSPTTGRISWNIPTPAAGCTADTQAYCGMVVTVDTKPTSAGVSPQKGTVYSSDPSVDENLFAGDKIDSAYVVGAFYHDRNTTFLDITGLKPNTPYYVTGFPVDCELRYFIEGVHAYSMEFKNRGSDGTSGTQVVVLNSSAPKMGVQPTDSTGLIGGRSYQFKMQVGILPRPNRPIDSVECVPTVPTYTITVDGALVPTYQQLVDQINRQIGMLTSAPVGPTPPNTGGYYWNNSAQKLFQWNGSMHVEQSVLIETQTPNALTTSSFWHNPSAGTIQSWNGASWVPLTLISLSNDPSAPVSDSSIWYNGTTAYRWNGVTWCENLLINQPTDPSLTPVIPAGSFWFNNVDSLYRWNSTLDLWTATQAVQTPIDPNALPVGYKWFNPVSSQLYQYNGAGNEWTALQNVAISPVAPATPAPGKLWFNPTTDQLFIRNETNTTWVENDVAVFPFDPTQRASCDVWWNTATDELFVWNSASSQWVLVQHFYQQAADPLTPQTISNGTLWYDGSSFQEWNGNCFVPADVIASPTDPSTNITIDTVWYNPTTGVWNIRRFSGWDVIDPITSPTDPQSLLGVFWFNPQTAGLSVWNGAAWVSVTYSTAPLTPTVGSLWFDTSTNTLKQWTSSGYALATPFATVELDCNGNLLFTDTKVGSLSFISITDVDLFSSLTTTFTIHNEKPGTDGTSSTPSYSEVGIGTDGNDALRKQIMNEIRYELGYPVVNVELTQEQMNYAIDRALGFLRQRSGIAYKRGFFFMSIPQNEQRFILSNKVSGMNKIVEVMGVYRLTGAFLSSAHGAGVYGQIVLQHLYNMGNFDLLSYHIMSEYTKLMEMLFAARLTFTWNEQTRELWIHNRFSLREKMVCIEATVERTEQDILADRYVQPWIRKYATAVCKNMLADIRGKFSTLPGASGNVTLNAAELRASAKEDIDACVMEIESYVVDRPEEYGIGASFTFG